MTNPTLTDRLQSCPLVAILRGVEPDKVVDIGSVLVDAGICVIEVPLNSPRPFDSIERLAKAFQDVALIGAGTVLTQEAVVGVTNAGGDLVVMPHADVAIIRAAVAAGAWCVPGVSTPTEAFAALAAGAHALKAFPAELILPPVLKAWLAVLPAGTGVIPVGGITPESMADYRSAGAAAFGLGSALFKPEFGLGDIKQRAEQFVAACA